MGFRGYAVVDLKTTGFSPTQHHGVAEIAIVHVSPSGEIEGAWETLVDPQRDLGPSPVHGIRGAESEKAPVFADVAGRVSELLNGRVLVAHNASFEVRFLQAEFARVGIRFPVDEGGAISTMRLAATFLPGSGRSLADCCAAYDIDLIDAHEALSVVAATALLLGEYLRQHPAHAVWQRFAARVDTQCWPAPAVAGTPWFPRPRGVRPVVAASFLSSTVAVMEHDVILAPVDGGHTVYLGHLDLALSDGFVSIAEADELHEVAASLGLNERERERLHGSFFAELARTAWTDRVLSESETAEMVRVGRLLSIQDDAVFDALISPPDYCDEEPAVIATEKPRPARGLRPGDLVVLTGELQRSRDDLAVLLRDRGLIPEHGLTRTVRVLVAADRNTLSGKARKARGYGIPLIDETELLVLLDAMAPIPALQF